ncbi:MAG: peptidoglycan DD-metalloendopeptidase family protein [Chloroflexota bacterium]|nr:peptidoglycan DD-metalloendopeptidase family protein [Chloroflexota bacterium]
MKRSLPLGVAVTLIVTLALATGARADEPTPSPSVAPTARSTQSPTVIPTPSPSGSPTPSPTPTLSPEELRAARSRIAAASLLERLQIVVVQVKAERRYIEERLASVVIERAAHEVAIESLRARESDRRALLARVLQLAYRQSRTSTLQVLLDSGSVVQAFKHNESLAAVAAQEQTILIELRAIAVEQARSREAIIARQAELQALNETLTVKDAGISKLVGRATRLADAARDGRDISSVEVEILKELAAEFSAAHEESEGLMADIARRTGVPLPRVDRSVWPTRGVVTQEFGPSALTLEPSATYKGVTYPHFHDGIDIAAPLGTPVLAAARGRVAFVGHLSDGAMVVIVAHEGGIVTLYGHLDDASLRPTVRTGDDVDAGAPLGVVGITGLTTGPHLHFVIRRGGEPIDPRSFLPQR